MHPFPLIVHSNPTLQARLRSLPLYFVLEVKVRLVEVVHAHVSVLSTTAVAGALWMYGDVVEGTEVTTHTTDFLHEDLVVEAGFEFTLARRCGSDVHGSLSSSENHVVFYGGDGGAIEGRVGNVRLEDSEVFDIDELGRLAVL
jgi:hypothetical protein